MGKVMKSILLDFEFITSRRVTYSHVMVRVRGEVIKSILLDLQPYFLSLRFIMATLNLVTSNFQSHTYFEAHISFTSNHTSPNKRQTREINKCKKE